MAIPSSRRITTREATVKTATVEVKVLSISGRQVTLAVFRQLIEEPLINPTTAELYGSPWGTVNYHWSSCGVLTGEHLHVVWQKGQELRRAEVARQRPRQRSAEIHALQQGQALRERASALATAILCQRLLVGQPFEGLAHDTWISVMDGKGRSWKVERS